MLRSVGGGGILDGIDTEITDDLIFGFGEHLGVAHLEKQRYRTKTTCGASRVPILVTGIVMYLT